MSIRLERDICGWLVLQIWASNGTLRVFPKRWAMPYGFHRWGFYGFGAGPFGFMYWPKRKKAAQ